jgi:hypothetical protein
MVWACPSANKKLHTATGKSCAPAGSRLQDGRRQQQLSEAARLRVEQYSCEQQGQTLRSQSYIEPFGDFAALLFAELVCRTGQPGKTAFSPPADADSRTTPVKRKEAAPVQGGLFD